MPFNISDFRAVTSTRGIARAKNFQVRFNLPMGLYGTSMTQRDIETTRWLSFYAESVSLPFFGVATHQAHRYSYGPTEKRIAATNFQDIQVNFIADDATDNLQLFYDWMNVMINFKMQGGINAKTGETNLGGLNPVNLRYEPYQLAYRLEYITDIEITLFDATGLPTKAVVLREAFPTGISLDLNWAPSDSYMRLPISFTYTDIFFGTIYP